MGWRIAVLDYNVVPLNPIGGCLWQMLRGLCHEHEFTVFAVEFDNPCPERIRFIRIPAPTRPLALLFLAYHLLAPLYYWAYRLSYRIRFDVVQMVESNLLFGDVSYSQILLANLFLHLQSRDFRRSAPRLWAFRGVMGEATFRRFRVRQQYPPIFATGLTSSCIGKRVEPPACVERCAGSTIGCAPAQDPGRLPTVP